MAPCGQKVCCQLVRHPKALGLKDAEKWNPGVREREKLVTKLEPLPTAGSDAALPAQSEKPKGTAWAQGTNRVPTEHLEANPSTRRELVTLPRAKIPEKGGETQVDLDIDLDTSWIAASSE